MCGICGYVHLDESKRPSEGILKAMMSTLVHRGPDDQGFYLADNIALGHRRLSIIDLETGRQPIYNEDRSIVIVYNGEVYNFQDIRERLIKRGHKFTTRSDTEVLVHAYEEYGEDCLGHFNGMFAFAIWDSNLKKLFLARDRFGKKPLYYAVFDNQFIFGSELKSILKHPSARKEMDMTAVSKYLAYEYVPSPFSIFKNIKKLEPGCTLSLKGKEPLRLSRYWDLRFVHRKDFDVKEAETELLRLLKASVKRRLISDVPLGVFLSGGVDSSSVVAMMAELMPAKDIKTFSIGFKEESFDESSDARLIANLFGTDHHEETLDPKTMLDIFPRILDILDEPFADSSIIPTYLVSNFTRRYVKVALGGDGGDELFLGYPSYLAHVLNGYFAFMPNALKKMFLGILADITPKSHSYMSLKFKAQRFLRGLDFPEDVRQQAWLGAFTSADEHGLFSPNLKLDLEPSNVYDITRNLFENVKTETALDRAIYIYVHTYLTDDILAKVDRASMANSLEVRAPLLDTEFAEFAAGIPSAYKLRHLKMKWILKDAFKDKLPKDTLSKPKHGFGVPMAKWLKEDLKGLLFDTFERRKIEREGIFDFAYVENLLKEFMLGRRDMLKEVWALFMFEMWYDRWMK